MPTSKGRGRLYPDETLLKILQEKSKKAGRPIRSYEMRSPSSHPLIQRFGTWNKALSLAKLPVECRKNIPSKIRRLNEIEKAYIAGLVDTDGWVSITANRVDVGVSSIYRNFLRHIQQICEGGNIRRNGSGGSNNNCRAIVFRRNEIRDLLPQLVPYLFIKKNKAKSLIKKLAKTQRRHRQYDQKPMS